MPGLLPYIMRRHSLDINILVRERVRKLALCFFFSFSKIFRGFFRESAMTHSVPRD